METLKIVLTNKSFYKLLLGEIILFTMYYLFISSLLKEKVKSKEFNIKEFKEMLIPSKKALYEYFILLMIPILIMSIMYCCAFSDLMKK